MVTGKYFVLRNGSETKRMTTKLGQQLVRQDPDDLESTFVFDTTQPGTASDTLEIPLVSGESYDFVIDWGDATSPETYTSSTLSSITHTYTVGGTYNVSITGQFPRIFYANSAIDREKILEVTKWGDDPWSSMDQAFQGCLNLVISAADAPNLSNCTSLSRCFANIPNFNSNLNVWGANVATIEDYTAMFAGDTLYNQPMDQWVTTAARILTNMFLLSGFNQSLDNFDVRNVETLEGTFAFCPYNQAMPSWLTQSLINLGSTFADNSVFDQDIDHFIVNLVTNFSNTFLRAIAYNQPIPSWVTSSGEDFEGMFNGAGMTFNQSLAHFIMTAALTIRAMFASNTAFTGGGISAWVTTNLQDAVDFAAGASNFNENLGSWPVGNLLFAESMLQNTGLSSTNLNALYAGWGGQTVQPNVTFEALPTQYGPCPSAGCTGRDNLTDPPNNWTIQDGGALP